MSVESQQYNKAYMGISLGSRLFSVRYIRNVISYAEQKFDNVLIVIAHRPHIYTFMAIKGYDPAAAEARALEIGEQKWRSVQRAIDAVPNIADVVTLRRWDDLACSNDFDMLQKSVTMLYDIDERFKKDICGIFEEHLRGGNYGHIAPDRMVLGQKYILDECAMMLYFQEYKGFSTQISPVEPPRVISEYYRGAYCECKGLPSMGDLHPYIHSMFTLGARKYERVSDAQCRESPAQSHL